MRNSPYEESDKVRAESWVELKKIMEAISVASAALELEARCAFRVMKTVIREYSLAKNTAFNELGSLHEVKTASALH